MPEKMIAALCSPTLSGIKTANLLNCEYETKEKLQQEITNMNARFASKGIHFMVLSYPSKNRALIYIFRPYLLQQDLNKNDTKQFMEQLGYHDHRIGCCLNQLREKMTSGKQFPHEIGCFLGYPCKDVMGFMNNEKCSYYGVWKVYGDIEEAKRLFEQYEICTKQCLEAFESGIPLEEIAVA